MKKIYFLNEEQKLRVEEARIDFVTGNTLTNDDVIEEIGNLVSLHH